MSTARQKQKIIYFKTQVKTEIGTLLIKEFNEKCYLQNTKISRKNSKTFVSQPRHEMAYSTMQMIGTLNLHEDKPPLSLL